MMLAKFRHRYPQGSLVSELIKIDRGTYIVKALVQIERVILATALASGATVEAAEDAAKERAIASLFLEDSSNSTAPNSSKQTERLNDTSASQATTQDSVPANTSNNQIVNFSKSQTEPAAVSDPPFVSPFSLPSASVPSERDNQDKPSELDDRDKPILETVKPAAADTPVRQFNLDTAPEHNPEPSSNLFGDTFAAANPTIDSGAIDSAEPITNKPADSSELEAMDFNEIKQKTDIEIRRLGWTKEQGREFLMSRYGKRSRLHLKDEQLIEFLHYLEDLPNPVK